jgi:hypothetical protein
MAKQDEDLGDLSLHAGLSDYFVDVAGLDNLGHGNGAIRFKMFRSQDGVESPVATLVFPVPPRHDGMEGMVARGYDDLVAALRQMLYQAATARKQYRRRAELYASAKAKIRPT